MGKVAANAMSRRKGNGSEQPSYFPIPPQSRLAATAPPASRDAFFVRGTNSHIKPALKGEVDASATSRRMGCIVAAVIYGNPSVSLRSTAPRQGSLNSLRKFAYSEFPAPSKREPFGQYLNSYVKPPSPREVSMSGSELTEGVPPLPPSPPYPWAEHEYEREYFKAAE